jgi:hypothetical protein
VNTTTDKPLSDRDRVWLLWNQLTDTANEVRRVGLALCPDPNKTPPGEGAEQLFRAADHLRRAAACMKNADPYLEAKEKQP